MTKLNIPTRKLKLNSVAENFYASNHKNTIRHVTNTKNIKENALKELTKKDIFAFPFNVTNGTNQEKMRCLISNSSNPYFNLATEEYFLKTSNDEIFMLYINEPTIVVGKHQNLYSEINLPVVRANKIKLARRISGGGTVYQDLNNLNFSFIHNCENREQINFTKFTLPILKALGEIGLKAEFSGRNDLLLHHRKISGNAMHIYKTRVLSHGTLLFNTDLKKLSTALKSNGKYADKSIKSVRSEVTNISDYLIPSKTIEQFTREIFMLIINRSTDSHVKSLDISEEEAIYKISKAKFETWDWIYGYSPKYLFRNIFKFGELSLNLELSVERGIITSTKIEITPENSNLANQIEEILTGTSHDIELLANKLSKVRIIKSDPKYTEADFCYELF